VSKLLFGLRGEVRSVPSERREEVTTYLCSLSLLRAELHENEDKSVRRQDEESGDSDVPPAVVVLLEVERLEVLVALLVDAVGALLGGILWVE
jgi:hypothetical protein